MGASRLKPLTVKEVEKLTATPPKTIKHHSLGGVPGFVLVQTPCWPYELWSDLSGWWSAEETHAW